MSSVINVKFDEIEKATIVTIDETKVFDEMIVNLINDKINCFLDSSEKPNFILDFSLVNYMSSSFLGKIISINKKLKAKNQRFILCGVNNDIMEIFQITKLDKFFTFTKNLEETYTIL